MLHALLHGKLDESTPDAERREDTLTSVVFGALAWTNSTEFVSRWLGTPLAPPRATLTMWFWPSLHGVEPDVLIRMGNILIAVEAKFRSNRHDVDGNDQLVRQYTRLACSPETRQRYDAELERALVECELFQAYVVNARKLHRAKHEWAESQSKLPEPARSKLRLVTWQSAFRLLRGMGFEAGGWSSDVRAYLTRCQLDTFEGITTTGLGADTTAVVGWRNGANAAVASFRTIPAIGVDALATIQSWNTAGRSSPAFKGSIWQSPGLRMRHSQAAGVLAWHAGGPVPRAR